MKRLLFFIIVLILFGHHSNGQNISFDSTKYFVKYICFIMKDSATGKKDTIWKDITYRTTLNTQWDYYKKKWITSVPFHEAISSTFYPLEDVAKIDSIFFPKEKYTIEKYEVSVVFNGGEMMPSTEKNYMDETKKEYLKRFSQRKCRI